MLCNIERETCGHLFTECSETWTVWTSWCKACGYMLSSSKDVRNFFESWMDCRLGGLNDRIWNMAYFAIAWMIWKCRNKVVFTGKEWNVGHCLELAKIRVAFWANVRWPNEYLLMIDVYIQPFEYSGPKQEKRGRKRITWDLQRMGEMKLNVDGTSKGCPRPVGIGGILRDSKEC